MGENVAPVGENGNAPVGAKLKPGEGLWVLGVIVLALEVDAEREREAGIAVSRCSYIVIRSCGEAEISLAVRNDPSSSDEEFEVE